MMTPLPDYLSKFSKLNVDKNRNRYSAGKAPHKPILLLSLMLLHSKGKVDLSDIKVDMHLSETWSELWRVLDYPRPGPIHLPMYHMRSDGFWNVEFVAGENVGQPKSIRQLERMVKSIRLDDDLIDALDDEVSRDRLINALLHGGYFSEEEVMGMKRSIETILSSFDYQERLSHDVLNEFNAEGVPDTFVNGPSRSAGFRRSILETYDETCSVCGMNIRTSAGVSIIDAAHILPFSRFQNDDIRNGLALCKIHHWLFDRGIITSDERYRVLISPTVEDEEPSGVLTGLRRRELILPEKAERYPHHVALEWHRKNIFQAP